VRGFTLLEMTAVLMVMALVAAAVTLSLAATQRRASAADAVEDLVRFDQLARCFARRQGRPVRLAVDLRANRLLRADAAGGQEGHETACPLGASFTLGEAVLAGRRIAEGRTALWVSDRGYSPTYALRLDGPSLRRWILFAGPTGQVSVLDDEKEFRETLDLVWPARRDAD